MTDRDRLIELYKEATTLHLDYLESIDQKGLTDIEGRAKFTADHLLANGVIVPPCKVGDWLWVVRKDYVSECFRVDGFDDKNLVMYMQDNEHNLSLVYKGIKIWRVSFADFGKTVFLTKEEAERELEKRKSNGTT